ncbi:MAG: HAD family phosphatase [Anaerolineae bacterium]|nr:HAD family phosphatase [Anaerolineae bacterium]MDW8171769.1 HAD family phosphatase [Anaerolineae bacterium]
MRYAAVCFDMDGTLVESENIWEDTERQMFEDRGLAYTDEVRQQVIGLRLDEFFRRLKAIFGLPESVEDLMRELEARILPRIPHEVKPKRGAQALIEWVAAQGVPYCIASSSSAAVIDAVVESQGWGQLITRRYSADLVAHGKPAPDIYLYAARQLGVDPGQCLALEDSPNGTRAAVAAGMTTIAVPDFHTAPQALQAITPHVYPSLEAVLKALQEGRL